VVVTRHDRGSGRFQDAQDRFGPSPRTRIHVPTCLAATGHEHGPVRPMTLIGKRPLTPLSRPPLNLHAHAPSCVLTTPTAPIEQGTWVGRARSPPRPPSPSVHENRRFWMTRGAFRRQGPFVGSGGRYSPGPAIFATALRRVRRPLDDALTSPWAFSRSRSVMSEAIRGGDSPFRISTRFRRVSVVG
jgi:hypothetical protein